MKTTYASTIMWIVNIVTGIWIFTAIEPNEAKSIFLFLLAWFVISYFARIFVALIFSFFSKQ